MAQQDKELLLQYLSMALPYGVKVQQFDNIYAYKLLGIDGDVLHIDCPVYDDGDGYTEVEYCKPYLRPMSSMTEEEETEYDILCNYNNNEQNAIILLGWILNKHFDIFGLIPMGLAIEVTEENNPYNTRKE